MLPETTSANMGWADRGDTAAKAVMVNPVRIFAENLLKLLRESFLFSFPAMFVEVIGFASLIFEVSWFSPWCLLFIRVLIFVSSISVVLCCWSSDSMCTHSRPRPWRPASTERHKSKMRKSVEETGAMCRSV